MTSIVHDPKVYAFSGYVLQAMCQVFWIWFACRMWRKIRRDRSEAKRGGDGDAPSG